nr:tRNA modification GTPase GTPBP3, mitochondrial isoform X1 [Leptinotarsa decemlineata]
MLKFCRIWKKFTPTLCRSSSSQTVFALSSGQGKCGVAVIRVSGSSAREALKLVLNSDTLPKPRTAVLKHIKHPTTKETLDKGLVLWFPGPKSFTGEDSFELQVHGGLAVVNGILNALGSIPQVRLAEPGEFTRRAFFNAKLDLTEVEGLADLLQAETEIQRRQAFLQTEGSLSKLYNRWKGKLTNSVAHLEAHIDFEETETLEHNIIQTVTKNVEVLAKEIDEHLTDGRKGEILRSGVKTVILGEPNVGKSSLLNLLCQRPAAIVTPIEGTTRDVLEVTLNIAGYPLVLADTAGLNVTTKDVVEKEGIQRALKMYGKSNLVILVIDSGKYAKATEQNMSTDFDNYIKKYIEKLKIPDLMNTSEDDRTISFNKHCIVVLNKSDMLGREFEIDEERFVKMSCRTEEGVPNLINRLTEKLKILCGEPSEEHPSMNQIRHRQHLTDCLHCLQIFLDKINLEFQNESHDLVLMAEYLRKSLRHLGKLTGNVTTDHLLDVIFKDFCIGK